MNTQLIKRALELFPEKNEKREIRIKFSRAFKGYNANCAYTSYYIEFRLSSNWKDVSNEIVIGLLQELFNKIYKKKRKSYNIELYNDYIKKSTSYSKIEKINPELKQCFNRVNEEYFNGMIDTPNLVWSKISYQKLGSYDFMTNTIEDDGMDLSIEDERDIDEVVIQDVTFSNMDVDDKDATVELELKVYYENSDGESRKKYITATAIIEDDEVEDLDFIETD